MPTQSRQRGLLRSAAMWWDSDVNRLRIIRLIAYGLFAASIVGTVYGATRGVLPLWAVTIYVSFAVQLTFMTFMYAIKHSGAEEVRRSIYDLRRDHVQQWKFEREIMAEFTRFAFCTSHGVDPGKPRPITGPRTRLRPTKTPWPTVNTTDEMRRYVREQLTQKIERQQSAKAAGDRPSDDDIVFSLDFIAYSAETLINLSRDICTEIDDIQQDTARYEGQVRVRILIRDTSDAFEWLVPLASDASKDVTYAADLRTRFRNVQRSALKEFQESLKDITSPRQVDFRVRGYRTEPLTKGVMVDGTRGLFGIYTVDDLKDPEGWDYSGHAVTLCPCDLNGGYVESLSADLFRRWFDHLWDSEQMTRSLDA